MDIKNEKSEIDSSQQEERAVLANLSSGYGFIIVIYSNDHNPANIHLYTKKEDLENKAFYTRVLIPKTAPMSIDDIQTVENNQNLNIQEKELILKFFQAPQRKYKQITNYKSAVLMWDIFQNDFED